MGQTMHTISLVSMLFASLRLGDRQGQALVRGRAVERPRAG